MSNLKHLRKYRLIKTPSSWALLCYKWDNSVTKNWKMLPVKINHPASTVLQKHGALILTPHSADPKNIAALVTVPTSLNRNDGFISILTFWFFSGPKGLSSCRFLLEFYVNKQVVVNGTPLQYSCLENPTDGGAWWATVHGAAKGRTWLSNFTFIFHFSALEKEMPTHSSVLAWRIPGTGSLVGCRLWGHTESDMTEVT